MSLGEKIATTFAGINALQKISLFLLFIAAIISLIAAGSDPLYYALFPIFRWNIFKSKERNIIELIIKAFIASIVIYLVGTKATAYLYFKLREILARFI